MLNPVCRPLWLRQHLRNRMKTVDIFRWMFCSHISTSWYRPFCVLKRRFCSTETAASVPCTSSVSAICRYCAFGSSADSTTWTSIRVQFGLLLCNHGETPRISQTMKHCWWIIPIMLQKTCWTGHVSLVQYLALKLWSYITPLLSDLWLVFFYLDNLLNVTYYYCFTWCMNCFPWW